MENEEYINRQPLYKQHWVLPIVLAILILPVLVLLPLQSQKIEKQERQEQLIADSLWVEQGIRNLLDKDEGFIRALGEDIALHRISKQQLSARTASLLLERPELRQITWFDDGDNVQFSTTPTQFKDLSTASQLAVQLARSSSLPQYAEPSYERDGETSMMMDYHYPLFNEGRYVGNVVARYSIAGLLDRIVPWWFTRDHEVSVVDMDDKVIAHHANFSVGTDVLVHNKSLDLPGVNLILRTNTNKSYPKHFSTLLISIVVALGLGLIWSLWALWRDILRRHAAENALRTAMAFRKAMEKSSVAGLRVRNMEGRLTYVNDAFCQMVGSKEDELLGQTYPYSFWTLEAYEGFANDISRKVRSEAMNGFETVYKHTSGKKVPVLIYESAMTNEHGTQIGWIGSILDITERKRTEQILREHEEKLHRNARLSTMGELASVMAHELNQPLTSINTYASGIAQRIESGKVDLDMLRPALNQMQTQAIRAAEIIRSVRDFVAKRSSTRQNMQINDVINNVKPIIELQAKSFLVKLTVDTESQLPDVYVDPVGIEEVLLNLTRNALQSMQALNLGARRLTIGARKCESYIRIEIIDNGSGIPKDIAERLNAPFFSSDAEGLGMGINICRTIIELHGGRLTFEENPDGGTISSFSVPFAR